MGVKFIFYYSFTLLFITDSVFFTGFLLTDGKKQTKKSFNFTLKRKTFFFLLLPKMVFSELRGASGSYILWVLAGFY